MQALFISCVFVVCFGAIHSSTFNIWLGFPTESIILVKNHVEHLEGEEKKKPAFSIVPNLLCNLGSNAPLLVKNCLDINLGTRPLNTTYPVECGTSKDEIFECERKKFCAMDPYSQFRKNLRDYAEARELVNSQRFSYESTVTDSYSCLRNLYILTCPEEQTCGENRFYIDLINV